MHVGVAALCNAYKFHIIVLQNSIILLRNTPYMYMYVLAN